MGACSVEGVNGHGITGSTTDSRGVLNVLFLHQRTEVHLSPDDYDFYTMRAQPMVHTEALCLSGDRWVA